MIGCPQIQVASHQSEVVIPWGRRHQVEIAVAIMASCKYPANCFHIQKASGLNWQKLGEYLSGLERCGLIRRDADRIELTEAGRTELPKLAQTVAIMETYEEMV